MIRRMFGYIRQAVFGGESPAGDGSKTTAIQDQTQTDASKKWSEEKQALTKQMDDAKKRYEDEISKLQDQLKKEKAGKTDSSTQKKEADLNKEWQEKCDRLVRDAEAKQKVALTEAQASSQQLEAKMKELETKYDRLRTQATEMKDKYEGRIEELERSSGDGQELFSEVKRVMSTVYHALKKEFQDTSSYKGSDINSTIMDTIKEVTIQLMEDRAEDGDQDKIKSDSAIEPKIKKTPGYQTGDIIGNPHYAAELLSKDDAVVSDSVLTDAPSVTAASSADISQKVDMLRSLVSQSDESPKVSDDGQEESGGPTQIFQQVPASPVTGGDGNPYRVEELQRKAKAQEIVADVIKSVVTRSPGPSDDNFTQVTTDVLGDSDLVISRDAPGSQSSTGKSASESPAGKQTEQKTAQSATSSSAAKPSDSKADSSPKKAKLDEPSATEKPSSQSSPSSKPEDISKDKMAAAAASKDSKTPPKDVSPAKSQSAPKDSKQQSSTQKSGESTDLTSKDSPNLKDSNSDSDDGLKPKPPPAPLFADDDDDDDDWLSK